MFRWALGVCVLGASGERVHGIESTISTGTHFPSHFRARGTGTSELVLKVAIQS